MLTRLFLISIWMFLVSVSGAWAMVAMITEVKSGDGAIELRSGGKGEWKRAAPLLSLEPGDTIRVSRSGSVVVMYANGKDVVRITATNSPFTIKALKKSGTRDEKTQALFKDLTGFLANKKRDTLSAPLAVRGKRIELPSDLVPAQPVHILAPAQTIVLNPRPAVEWVGPARTLYAVRMLQGDRIVWERKNLVRPRLAYPADEAGLAEGVRYALEVRAGDGSPATTWIQVATAEERKAVEAKCAQVEQSAAESLPVAVKTSLLYAVLASEGYWFDARERLLAAMNADNDNPLLHLLLGDYYSMAGVQHLASEEYEEAEFLLRVQR